MFFNFASKQLPMNPTATNIINVWCKEYRKDPKKLKRDDWKQLIAYAVRIGQFVGIKQSQEALQNVNIEKAEGEPEGETTEPSTID